MAAIPLYQPPIEYPTSDGKPVGETTLHFQVIVDLVQGLQLLYLEDPETWVGGNLFFCYQEGDSSAVVCPDVLLVHGVSKRHRRNYLLWEERTPSLMVEVTSKSTHREDTAKKKKLYERLGVEEYVLFDPYREYLHPPLQGFRLESSRYEPIRLEPDGKLRSRTAGVLLQQEPYGDGGQRLRLFDAGTGAMLLRPEEMAAERRMNELELRKVRDEARRFAETARYADQQAAVARQREAEAEQRATEAEQRTAALEAEIARLRAERG
jgi:Uma2 family endonuclease